MYGISTNIVSIFPKDSLRLNFGESCITFFLIKKLQNNAFLSKNQSISLKENFQKKFSIKFSVEWLNFFVFWLKTFLTQKREACVLRINK